MSLANALGARAYGVPEYVEPRPPWYDQFAIEEICLAEPQEQIELVPTPLPVDSKRLFLASAQLPHSDRLQVNFARLVRNFCAHMLAWHGASHISIAAHKPDAWFDFLAVGQHSPSRESEKEVVISRSAKMLSGILNRSEDELVVLVRRLVWDLTPQASAPEAEEKVLETFVGYVEQVDGDTAYVRLKSRDHGDVLYGKYSASELASKGIFEQSRFQCETVKFGGSTRHDLKVLPDVEVSEEELRAIGERIHRVIPRDNPGIEY